MNRFAFLMASALTLASPRLALAQDTPKPGSFGFAIDVDGEGFWFNPTLKSVTIKSVTPGRPASDAGVKAGDQIVEIEGKQVVGSKARDLEPYLRRNVGEAVNLRLRRITGEIYSATLVAAPKTN